MPAQTVTSSFLVDPADYSVGDVHCNYREIRGRTEGLCAPLEEEDYVVQTMPDVSPTKWHLAHTTWFFETFVLKPFAGDYEPFHPQYQYLFNSYYNAVGDRAPRPKRGFLSRPTVQEVFRYRSAIDEQIQQLLEDADEEQSAQIIPLMILGHNHEQQHQELLLTDIKHVLGWNPLRPIYKERFRESEQGACPPLRWKRIPAGVHEIGHAGAGFAFDNESPRHCVYLQDAYIGSRLITCGEYREFMADGGYERPELWLSDGWYERCEQGWRAPLYWEKSNGEWRQMTLAGMRPVEAAEPVCHVSYYEADAFARWAGKRLPTEAEWEVAAADAAGDGNFLECETLHPLPCETGDDEPYQMFGDVWEWTQSPYSPYPGYKAMPGALGEYNGKFMCNQMVLRGGSCATPQSHMRPTYRNFFPPDARWQFSGIRLAEDEG